MKRVTLLAAGAAIAILAAALMFAIQPWRGQDRGAFSGFVKGQYDSLPRYPNGTADVQGLAATLADTNTSTYNYLLGDPVNGMGELEGFLVLAKERGIKVWVTILPPSELGAELRADRRYTDYPGLARSLASLSLKHDNLVAWGIDNVLIDYGLFTADYLKQIIAASGEVNPGLWFVPVIYYQNVIGANFDDRSRYFDGVQFYYTHFPQNAEDESALLLSQLEVLKTKFQKPIVLGIYATPMSPDRPTSAQYVEQLINLAGKHTQGVMIYTLQREGEKHDMIKRKFGEMND